MKQFFLSLFLLPAILFAESEKTIVLAGSDFQGRSDSESALQVGKILSEIRAAGYRNVSAVLFCGDYTIKLNNRPQESESGIASLKKVLLESGLGIAPDEIILVQGNHDPVGTAELAESGANDPAHGKYGIFVINEDDYMWRQGKKPSNGNVDVSDDAETVAETARNLDAYLTQKYKEKFSAPIFICSHLPLHYSMRCYNDGDGTYAKYIFDCLNRHAERGLKIFFLYGHNHSNGWDNYIGGARVFLLPGKEIPVAVPADNRRCTGERLAFTYMNAGFTGYVSTTDPNDGADRMLTMSVFEISADGNVVVKRYSASGPCELNAPGVPNTRNGNQESKLNLY